jgi:hypothetical protein
MMIGARGFIIAQAKPHFLAASSMSDFGGRPEVSGVQSERRDCPEGDNQLPRMLKFRFINNQLIRAVSLDSGIERYSKSLSAHAK